MNSYVSKIRLPPLPSIRDLVKLYKLRAIKQLSQNFLMDERLTDKIVKAAGTLTDHYVCEVGPGPGGISRSIIKKAPKKLILVEKDPRFLPSLMLLKESCLNYTKGAPKMDWTHAPPPIHLIGNLPFSVSTILIIKWLEAISEKKAAWAYGRTSMTLTFQKEVAERMVAQPYDKVRSFVPKPDVDVGVVTLIPLKKALIDMPFSQVEKVVRTIFNTRQKYCMKGAQKLFPAEQTEYLTTRLFVLANVNPTTRSYQLTNEDFVRLCYAYKIICDEYPAVQSFDYRASKGIDIEPGCN
ncbi:hypothetical protein GWI33_004152 [Rhynchophorus ferrugineus]|uniref:rRNA adenine N(6)-methyltransferase n=1 Tax=Rhynchophorus ferrugineus TaxID=354439 RepID=A0A834HK47_RHYFE|nr:hypothetical protein GWI33_004152 [Rhynchophorus ferrugineus]